MSSSATLINAQANRELADVTRSQLVMSEKEQKSKVGAGRKGVTIEQKKIYYIKLVHNYNQYIFICEVILMYDTKN